MTYFGMAYAILQFSWWRHQMETFLAWLAICAGNSPVPGEFPAQRPVTRSFDVFFDLHLNKPLSKQWRGWWFETLSCPLWRHCNVATLSWRFHGFGQLSRYIESWNSACVITAWLCSDPVWVATHLLSLTSPFYCHKQSKIETWISNLIHRFMWDVITHPCHKFNDGLP